MNGPEHVQSIIKMHMNCVRSCSRENEREGRRHDFNIFIHMRDVIDFVVDVDVDVDAVVVIILILHFVAE